MSENPSTDYPIKPPFDFGRVMSQTFSGLFRNLVPVLTGSLFISCLGAVIMFASDAITPTGHENVSSPGNDLIGLLTSAYLLFLGSLYYGFCMDVSYRTLLGYPVGLTDSLRRSLPHAFPLMIIAILFWLGFMLGYVALIIPALILSAGWAICGPAYQFGGASILESFGESWRLTRGYKWMVWLVNFLVGIIAQIGAIILAFLIIFVALLIVSIFQDAEIVADQDAEMSRAEIFAMFLTILFIVNLLAGLYASMKAAIYAECVELQDRWAGEIGTGNPV